MSEQPESSSGAAPTAAPARLSRDERRARLLILVGTILLLAGIALGVTDDDIGRWLMIGGIVTLFVALHRFGRLGAGGSPA
jgi:hypothetical protein